MAFYRECVRRQVALNGGRTHLSKNPTFCGRIESLIETFPDAKFVVLMRNPNETVPSLLKMLQTSWTLQHRDERLIAESLRILAEQSFHTYEHPLDVLTAHPETPSAWSTTAIWWRSRRRPCAMSTTSWGWTCPGASRRDRRLPRPGARDHPPLQPRRVRARPAGDPGPPRRSLRPLRLGHRRRTRTCQLITARARLRAAWDDLIAGLSRARDAIESEELHAPAR